MSRCDCKDCEEYRDKERAWDRAVAAKRLAGLARIGRAVALWGAMASASKAAIAYTAGVSYSSVAVAERQEKIWRRGQPPWFKKPTLKKPSDTPPPMPEPTPPRLIREGKL